MDTFWRAWIAAFASFATQSLTTPFWPIVAIAMAVVLATTVGSLRRYFWERGWNTRPPAYSPKIDLLRALAFTITVTSAIGVWSLQTSSESIHTAVAVAHSILFPKVGENTREGGWRRSTFVHITEEVYTRRLEDLDATLRPVDGGTSIPLTNPETARVLVDHYLSEVDHRFASGDLGLPGLLWSQFLPRHNWPIPARVPLSFGASTAATADFARIPFLRNAVEARLGQLQQSFLQVLPNRGTLWPFLVPAILFQLSTCIATARAAWRDLRLTF